MALAKVLVTLEAQLRVYRTRIEELFAQHPDHDLFGSLPGAGDKLAPRLLAEIGQERERFEDASALQSYAGTAPVTVRSGQVTRHRFRQGANPILRASVHLWADLSRKKCAWAQAYYQAHRAKGQSMPARCVVWVNAGSTSSGKCGKPKRATTRRCTLATKPNTALGCFNSTQPKQQSKPVNNFYEKSTWNTENI